MGADRGVVVSFVLRYWAFDIWIKEEKRWAQPTLQESRKMQREKNEH